MTIKFRVLSAATAAVAGLSIALVGCSAKASPSSAAPVRSVPGASMHRDGPFPGLRYRYGGTASLNGAPAPASSALPGANDLLAVGAADTSAAHATPASVLAAADSGVWRSADGGRTWQQELGGIRAWSLTAIPGGGYAALGDLPLPSGASGIGAPVLATSANGISWRMAKVTVPASSWSFGYGYQFVLSGLGTGAQGVAVPDNGAFEGPAMAGGPTAYRTTDGGRRWIPLSLPGASGGLAMLPDGHTIFATGSGEGSGCVGAVYKSTDDGASWTRLPGSCQPYPLLAVQFVSSRIGFAAGGVPAKFGGEQLVEATTNGGQTWQPRWRTPTENGANADDAVLRLDMLTARQGWAVTGGCVGGQNEPCPGTVYVTSDGGYRWQRTSQRAIALVALGPARALAVDDITQTAAATTDGGRTWITQSRPGTIMTSEFAGVGDAQFWATNLGDFLSRDGSRHWAAKNELASPRFTYLSWQAAPPARLLGYNQDGDGDTWASSDGGRTWTAAIVPGATSANQLLAVALESGGTAVAVTGSDGDDCLSKTQISKVEKLKPGWKPPTGASVLYTSTTGGARWDQIGLVLPFGVGLNAAVAVSGDRIAIIDACNRLQLSTDGGAHWTAQALSGEMFCTVSQLSPQSPSQLTAEIWLACTATNADTGNTDSWVLHSADGGSTWLAYRLPATANASYGIFATGPGTAVMPVGGSIWRTTDGGKSWNQSWPAL